MPARRRRIPLGFGALAWMVPYSVALRDLQDEPGSPVTSAHPAIVLCLRALAGGGPGVHT